MRIKLNFIVVFLTLNIISFVGNAQMNLSEQLVVGEETFVQLDSLNNDTIVITYRPNSIISTQETLHVVVNQKQFKWAPEKPGIVLLSSKNNGTLNASVRFKGNSISGIGVMLWAAIILFGGVLFSFKILFEKEDGKEIFTKQFPDT